MLSHFKAAVCHLPGHSCTPRGTSQSAPGRPCQLLNGFRHPLWLEGAFQASVVGLPTLFYWLLGFEAAVCLFPTAFARRNRWGRRSKLPCLRRGLANRVLQYWVSKLPPGLVGVGGTWVLAHSIRQRRPGEHIKLSLLYGDALLPPIRIYRISSITRAHVAMSNNTGKIIKIPIVKLI